MKKLLITLFMFSNSLSFAESANKEMIKSVSFTEYAKKKVKNTLANSKGGTCRVNGEDVSIERLCDIRGSSSNWKANCSKLLSDKQGLKGLPIDALAYALNVLKKNETKFKSNKCYEFGTPGHYSEKKLKAKNKKELKNGYLKNGITNKCQILINDLDQRVVSHGNNIKCRTKTFYVDLCGSSPKVKKFETFIGYGSCKPTRKVPKGLRKNIKNGYVTYEGRKLKVTRSSNDTPYIKNTHKDKYTNKTSVGTTLIGAFITGTMFDYKNGYSPDQYYRKLRVSLRNKRNWQNTKIPAAVLWGLNSTNSRSAKDMKYLHVSPYTSAGCVSVPVKNYDKVIKLIKSGPSLVVNYKKGMMEDINKCSE